MRPMAWAIFFALFAFVLGGLVGVGFVLDTLFLPAPFIGINDTSTGEAVPIGFTFSFAVLGVFFGIIIGYRGAWHFTIGRNIEQEMHRLEGLVLDELEGDFGHGGVLVLNETDDLEKGGRNGHNSS